MMKREIRLVVDGREIRFTNFIDAESITFDTSAREYLPLASTEQTLNYAEVSGREFYLMQNRSADGRPGMQALIYLGRPKLLRSFAMATVSQLGRAKNPSEEEFGLKMLRKLCMEIPEAMTLRLQPQRFDIQELANFEERANQKGYKPVDPMGVTRTLLLDLEVTPEALLVKLSQKTRQKIRQAGKAAIEIKGLSDDHYLQACREAANESRKRSGTNETPYDFEAAFSMAKKYPNHARILGLFLKSNPEKLMAYVIGYRLGNRAEYASAGSYSSPELRAMPFNYFLFWELANWARAHGSLELDMGGVTDGGEKDPLQGISRFKRSIAFREIETGREFIRILRPIRYFIYRCLKQIKTWLQTDSVSSAQISSQTNSMGLLPVYD